MAERIFKGCEFLVNDVDCSEVFTPEDFNDEHKQIAETTEQFITNEIMPIVDEIEAQNFDVLVEGLRKSAELGLLMIDAPEEFGGLELDKATSMLVAEKSAPSGAFGVAYLAHTGIGTLPLVYYGNNEQKKRYLESLLTGEFLAAFCLTEPEAGSDALSARTTATLSEDGKHYILNGTKQFITNAGFADLFTVFAKVDKEHFTGFLVERSFEGVEIGPEEKKMGIKGSSTCQLILNDAKIPVKNLLGEVGKGHKIAFNVLNVGRFKLGAVCVGTMKYALAEGAAYANVRKQFNVPIGSFGAIKEKLADVVAASFACEAIVYRLAGLLDKKIATIDKGCDDYYAQYQKAIEEYAAECAMAKVYCSEAVASATDEVLQIHGGYGFISEYPIERMYRDERVQRIYEGTNEINRLLIPGTFLRKGLKGELPIQSEIEKAVESLKNQVNEGFDSKALFAEEKALLKRLKALHLVLIGTGSKKYQKTLLTEQEVVLTLADMSIQIFAMESVLLRCEKIYANASATKKQYLDDVVKVCTLDATEKLVQAARKGAFYVLEGEILDTTLDGIQRLSKYRAVGLLESKRSLANAALENEKYFF
jgi:alkylation response protein AidB-like acyl-CoA dehydrogenase